MNGDTDEPWLITNKTPNKMRSNNSGNSQSLFESFKYIKNS